MTVRTRTWLSDKITTKTGLPSWRQFVDFLDSVLFKADGEAATMGDVTVTSLTTSGGSRHVLPPTAFRVFDAMKDSLPDAATADDLGIADAAGSPILSSAANNTHIQQNAAIYFTLPPTYKAGAAVTVKVRAKLAGAIAVTKTLDCVAKEYADGALGSDICATAAQVLATDNAYATYSFTITPTDLVAGDVLYIELLIDLDDTGGSANKAASIAGAEILLAAA